MSSKVSRRVFMRLVGTTGAAAALTACAPTTVAPAAAPTTAPVAADAPAATTAPAATVAPVVTKAPAATIAAKNPLLSTGLDHVSKFSYLRPVWGPATHQKGADFEKFLFKTANAEIDSIIIPVVDIEAKLPVMVAGGTMPDVMWHAGPTWGPAKDWIDQGAFIPMDDYLAKYPGVKNAISDDVWNTIASPDGKHYFFPNGLAFWVPFPLYYRKDIFQELGIAEPTTLDELTAALRTIKAKKPDMVPFTTHEPALWYLKELATCFNYNMGGWVPDPADPNPANPAKIIPGNVDVKAYKDFLAWVQMLRKEGLLDPDFLVAQNKKGIDKFNGGQAAVMAAHWGSMVDILLQVNKALPGKGDVGMMSVLQGPARMMGGMVLNPYDRGFSITQSAKNKLDDVFAFLNWAYTDGYELMYYGIEGEMFTRAADGKITRIPDESVKPGFKRENVEPFNFPPKTDDTLTDWAEISSRYKLNNFEAYFPQVRKMFEDMANNSMQNYNRNTFSPTAGKIGGKIFQQYVKPAEEKVIIDPSTPLSTIDDAIKAWLDNGGSTIIEETNELQKDKSNPQVKYAFKP